MREDESFVGHARYAARLGRRDEAGPVALRDGPPTLHQPRMGAVFQKQIVSENFGRRPKRDDVFNGHHGKSDTNVSLQSQYQCIGTGNYGVGMSASARIRKAMKEAGIVHAAELARASGISEPTVRAYLNGNRQLSTYAPAAKIARVLNVTAEYLLGASRETGRDAGQEFQPVHMVAVRGKVQAGSWNEFEDFDASHLDPVPTIPGRWISFEQFAYQVSGPSMDRAGILDGDFVICVPYGLARSAPGDKDIVVVERRRGPTLERTVKRLRLTADGCELWPESTDPRFQTPIRVARNGEMHEDDGTTVEIVGLVIGRWAPM